MLKEYPVKLSIAVITYNHENYLTKALNSIFEQIHDYSFEVIINDDCSTDSTPEIINSFYQKYPTIIHPILHKKNIGISKNVASALKSCRGEYITILDGDDYWTEPDKLKRQISFLDKNPQFALSSHRCKHLDEETQELVDDPNGKLFEDKPQGFEFDQELYFKYWLTRTLSVVIRESALDIGRLEARRYCWDVVIFWIALTKGKGYAHNFFGGTYLVHRRGFWSGSDELKQSNNVYLTVEEMRWEEPDNRYLKEYFENWRSKLRRLHVKNQVCLDLDKVKNKNFTIISDDGWGGEVYKAFNLQPLSPFIGIKIYNDDFLELISNLKYYVACSLKFKDVLESKHIKNHKYTFGKTYPMAILGDKVELHFINYDSADDATKKWTERVERINWNNLFVKMDVSREPDFYNTVIAYNKIEHFSNKVCFLDAFRERDIAENFQLKNAVTLINNWNPESDLLFLSSLDSFDLIGWLNRNAYTIDKPTRADIIDSKCNIDEYNLLRYDDHFFIKFDAENIGLLDSYYPDTISVGLDKDAEYAVVTYNKSGLEHFRLSVREKPNPVYHVNLFIDLTNKKDRHVFILLKGNNDHKLGIDFVPYSRHGHDYNGIHLNVNGFEQDIPHDFEWLHFDFSSIDEPETDEMFGTLKSFCFYINPNEKANGTLEIMAVFIGSTAKFKEIIG